nr:ribonuclease H-like domain-containing protein [Tanacetum cinerariifolium]
MVANQHFIVAWPKDLPLDSGVPLLCVGISVYSPMCYYGLDKLGMHVGVVGLGSCRSKGKNAHGSGPSSPSFNGFSLNYGSLNRYKAHLVANGCSQQIGVDCDETFSPVVKPATIRNVLSLAASRHWLVHQLDVNNAFLYGQLSETVYMHQLLGFHDPRHPDHYDPREPHLVALKRILPYVHETLDYGLQLYSSSGSLAMSHTHSLLPPPPPSLSVTLSLVHRHYHGVANVVVEIAWLHNLLCKLHSPLKTATLVYCDNIRVVYLSSNPVQYQRTKHIEIDVHFFCNQVAPGHVHVLHVPSRYQFVNIFTKGLLYALFDDFVPPSLAVTARG